MNQIIKLIFIVLSLSVLNTSAFSQDYEDAPEEPMCDAASLKGAVVAHIDNMFSGDDGEDDYVEPESEEDDGDAPSFDKFEDALKDMSKSEFFYKNNFGLLSGAVSKKSLQDLKGLDKLDFDDEASFEDDDLLGKLYIGDSNRCGNISELLNYKPSTLSKLSKTKLKILFKSATILGNLVDGISEAELIESEESSELTDLVNKAKAAVKAAMKKAKK